MKKRMSHAMSKVNDSGEANKKAKGYSFASEWPKCSHAGCPLPTTIKADNCTCTYHRCEHGYSAQCITEAINELMPLKKKHDEMVFWTGRQWNENKHKIMGCPVLAATEDEMGRPTMYLKRFHAFISKSIKEKAEEIYKHGQ